MRFVPWREDAIYVQVTETGFSGDGDEIVSRVAGSMGGFYQVLCALKALLEHNVVLTVVLDHAPRTVSSCEAYQFRLIRRV